MAEKIESKSEKKKIATKQITKAPEDWEPYVGVGKEKWAEDLVGAALSGGPETDNPGRKEKTEVVKRKSLAKTDEIVAEKPIPSSYEIALLRAKELEEKNKQAKTKRPVKKELRLVPEAPDDLPVIQEEKAELEESKAKKKYAKIIPVVEIEKKVPHTEMEEENKLGILEAKLPPLRRPSPKETGVLDRLTVEEKQTISEIEGDQPEANAKSLKEEYREAKLARIGAEITLSKITNYEELNAKTEQEGNEKFLQKTRELWKEFAVHGLIGYDQEGNVTIANDTDLDGKGCLFLAQAAGFNIDNLKYIEHGNFAEDKIYFDVGDVHGVVLKDGGKKVFIDHHTDESGRESSATKFTYELLQSLGLLKWERYLDNMVDFITRVDNKDYFSDEENFRNSWKTIYGLRHYIGTPKLVELFQAGVKPGGILPYNKLKKFGLDEASRLQQKTINISIKKMQEIEKGGFVVSSRRFGKIAIDIGKKVGAGYDAVRAFGYQTYVIWNPKTKSFFITSKERLDKEKFGQGRSVRGHMWIKPRQDREPLKVKLADILNTLTDGKFEPTGKLKEFMEKESSETKLVNPEEFEIYLDAGNEFYEKLKNEFHWENYSEERKKQSLEIETEVFLTSLLPESIKKQKAEKEEVLKSLMAKIIK